MFVTSDVLASNYERLFGTTLPFPSVADSFHLAFYPFLVGGMLLLIHERDEDRDRSALIDALTVTLALGTLLWVYLISPYANDQTMSTFTRLASIGYPAMDILVIGVLARMAAGSHRREPSFVFMLSGVGALLLSDAFYGWRLLESHHSPGPVTMAGWAVFYVLLGTAAMHPSMRRLSEPGPRASTLTRARLSLLACASLTVPLVIILRRALDEHIDLYVLVGASAAMFALVLLRMAGIVRRHEEVTVREAALRIELTEQSLHRRSEERLSALIKNSSDVVCVLAPDTLVTLRRAPRWRVRSARTRRRSPVASCWRSSIPRTSRAAALADRRDRRAARRAALSVEFRVAAPTARAGATSRRWPATCSPTRRSRGSC